MSSDPSVPSDVGATRVALGVLALCIAMNMLSRGISDTYAVFLLPLSREFGADRAALTSVYSVYMLVYGLAAPAAGIAFDRFGPRALYCIGIALFGTAYVLAGAATVLWQLYLLIGVAGGIGSVALGMVPASALVSRWFRERLPAAMSVLYAALGVGVLLLAPSTQWLIERTGWRVAYWVLGGGALLLLPLMLVLPWRTIGLGHAAYREAHKTSAGASSGATLWRALRTPAFWGLFGVMFITSVATFTIVVQLVAYLVEVGFAPLEAASIYGVMGMLSIIGMLGTGAAATRFGERRVAALSYSCTIAGIAALALLEWRPGYALVGAFALLFGAMQGSRGPLVATLAARLFDRSGLGAVYGCISLGMGVGAAIGSAAAGTLHDLTGGYRAGFVLAAAGAFAGIALFRFIDALSHPPPARGRESTDRTPPL
jgi:MFS family permease